MTSDELTQARSAMNAQLDALRHAKRQGDESGVREEMEKAKQATKRYFQAYSRSRDQQS